MIRRVAIVGLGRAARLIHLPALRKIPQLEIVGGYDLHPSSVNDTSLRSFSSVQELLSQGKPELLVIATPPESHFDLALKGLQAGCHVFCEKPLTETLEEADQLAVLADRSQRRVFVNSEFPWMPIHAEARRRIGRPEFGELRFISMHQTFLVTEETEQGWRGRDLRRTFKEFGAHVLDLAAYFYSETPLSVRARMPRPTGPDTPDLLNMVELRFSGDRWASITLDRLSKGRHRYLDIRLDGAQATIETSLGGRMRMSAGVNGKSRRPFVDVDMALGGRTRLYRGERHETIARAPLDLFADATARLLSEALEAIERGAAPPNALPQARRTLALLLACYDSAEADGSEIRL